MCGAPMPHRMDDSQDKVNSPWLAGTAVMAATAGAPPAQNFLDVNSRRGAAIAARTTG